MLLQLFTTFNFFLRLAIKEIKTEYYNLNTYIFIW